MKKLLIILLLFNYYMGMGQTDSASIIGKSIKIGKLLVAQNDFPTKMNFMDAKNACSALGNPWRLPTKDELNTLYHNKNLIGGFTSFQYWSSTEYDFYYASYQDFFFGGQSNSDKNYPNYVRAIRTF